MFPKGDMEPLNLGDYTHETGSIGKLISKDTKTLTEWWLLGKEVNEACERYLKKIGQNITRNKYKRNNSALFTPMSKSDIVPYRE